LDGMVALRLVFGASDKNTAYYKWKIFDNPLGKGMAWVAKDGGRVIGMRSLVLKGDGIYETGDTFIHPDYQRKGIFTRMFNDGEHYFAYGTPNYKSITPYLRLGYRVAPIELRSYIGLHIGCRAKPGLPDPIPDDPNFLIRKTTEYLSWRFAGSQYQFWHTEGGFSITKGNLLADYSALDEAAFRRLIPNGVVRTWAVKGSMYDRVLLRLWFIPVSKIPVIHNGEDRNWLLTWGDTSNI